MVASIEGVEMTCALCGHPLSEDDAVKTKAGDAHESCADLHYPVDHGDSIYPR